MKQEIIENKLNRLGLGFVKVSSSTQVMTELSGGELKMVTGGASSGGSSSTVTSGSKATASSGGSKSTKVGSSKR